MEPSGAFLRLRPISYSDSFLYLSNSINNETFTIEPLLIKVPSISSIVTVEEQGSSTLNPLTIESLEEVTVEEQGSSTQANSHYTPFEKWYNRLIGFGVHIVLLSLFETIFFFKYVSESEDTGLENMVEHYASSILDSCNEWSSNTTILVNDVLALLLNATNIQEQGSSAYNMRMAYNDSLELKAWMYVLGLFLLVILGTGIGYKLKMRLAWRRILIDNIIMIGLLGIYEWSFFKTIIYNYDNLSLPELNEFVLNQLQTTCNLL